MFKSELAELARYGVRQKLAEMQQYLLKMFRDFPEEFSTTAAPVFLRPDEKRNGNSWPAFKLADPESNGHGDMRGKRVWSDEQRAAAAARMRKNQRLRHSRTGWGSALYQRAHDDLLAQPNRASTVMDVAARLGADYSSVRSAIVTHQKMFRSKNGAVQLIKPATDAAKAGFEKVAVTGKTVPVKRGQKRQPPHKWGDKVWQEVHDFLADQPEHSAPLAAIMKKVNTKVHATVLSAVNRHPDVLTRSGPGTYSLVRVLSKEEKAQAASGVPQGASQ